jgi:hypothetical protein
MKYIITVNRARLDNDPSNPRVIRVEDVRTGEITHHAEVRMQGRSPVIKYGPARADGAKVWIECDLVEVPDD